MAPAFSLATIMLADGCLVRAPARLGIRKQAGTDPLPAKLGKRCQDVDIPRAGRLGLQGDQRAHDFGQIVEIADVVGIVERIVDDARGDFAVDLGDCGVPVAEITLLARGPCAAEFEHRLLRRFHPRP